MILSRTRSHSDGPKSALSIDRRRYCVWNTLFDRRADPKPTEPVARKNNKMAIRDSGRARLPPSSVYVCLPATPVPRISGTLSSCN